MCAPYVVWLAIKLCWVLFKTFQILVVLFIRMGRVFEYYLKHVVCFAIVKNLYCDSFVYEPLNVLFTKLLNNLPQHCNYNLL